jgi:hypothetical protein
MGVWGKTWNRAVVFGAGGVPGFRPVRFRIGPPPASASAQAGGGPRQKRSAQRPYTRALRCTVTVRTMYGCGSGAKGPFTVVG